MGHFTSAKGKFGQALPLFQSVVQQEPGHLKAQYQLAQTYFRLNQPEQAGQALAVYKRLQDAERSQRKQLFKDSEPVVQSSSPQE